MNVLRRHYPLWSASASSPRIFGTRCGSIAAADGESSAGQCRNLDLLNRGLHVAQTGDPLPVHIDIPSPVLGQPIALALQEVAAEAKPYQIRQFLRLVERYNLRMKGEP